MLKRNGEECRFTVPDFVGRLTRAEFEAYNEAFDGIKDEFAALQRVQILVKELGANLEARQSPDSQFAGQCIKTLNPEDSRLPDVSWEIRARLLQLSHCEVLLCERTINEEKEYAVVERYQYDSAYAQANGNTMLLLTSNDPVLVTQDYVANAQHTIRFMASNMVATAQTIVWERFANNNASRVIRAISERCAKAAGEAQNEIQRRILERGLSQRQSKERQQSFGQSV